MYIHVYVILQRERMRQRDTMKGIDEEERKSIYKCKEMRALHALNFLSEAPFYTNVFS